MKEQSHIISQIKRLNTIGIALSAEKNTDRLLEMILDGAKSITNADGGTLYLATQDRQLEFAIMKTSSLGIAIGGTSTEGRNYPPIPLYDDEGNPNLHMVAAYAAHQDKTVNIPDARHAEGFDFSGTMEFDKKTGYRSKSFLTIPMKNHENNIIGVLQLINATDRENGRITAFSAQDQELAQSLASQAAIALTNNQLISELRTLFEKFNEVIAIAIDEKSPYTGGHCRRVPVLAMMLADAVNQTTHGPLKDFTLSDAALYELKIAALLHDCGKIATPVHVVDKATKLETLHDRINLIDTRFEVLKRDTEIEFLKSLLAAYDHQHPAIKTLEAALADKIDRLHDDREFIRRCNAGGEYMAQELQNRVKEIAQYVWVDHEGNKSPFLSEDEIHNLNIPKGTLTPAEREIINQHVVSTINMLEALPFPRDLRNVPEIAGGHHEKINGEGYPRGLKGGQLSIQARILGISDIFEALTAADRPYKEGMKLSQALNILGRMKLESQIDPNLFDIFINRKIYLEYAKQFLKPEQIDEVDVSKIAGYAPLADRLTQLEHTLAPHVVI